MERDNRPTAGGYENHHKPTVGLMVLGAIFFGFVLGVILSAGFDRYVETHKPTPATKVAELTPEQKLADARKNLEKALDEVERNLTDAERDQNKRVDAALEDDAEKLDKIRFDALRKNLPGWVTHEFFAMEVSLQAKADGARPLMWGTGMWHNIEFEWFGNVDATGTLNLNSNLPEKVFVPLLVSPSSWKPKYCKFPEVRACDAGGAFEDIVLKEALKRREFHLKVRGHFYAPPS